jgi:hypothetical protein
VQRVSLRMPGLSVYANAARFSQFFIRLHEGSANYSWSWHMRLYFCMCVRYSDILSDFRPPFGTFGYSNAKTKKCQLYSQCRKISFLQEIIYVSRARDSWRGGIAAVWATHRPRIEGI